MTEFKQDNFTFVDIISLIFIFFLSTANFFALLYLTDGKMPISLAITVLVFYYAGTEEQKASYGEQKL